MPTQITETWHSEVIDQHMQYEYDTNEYSHRKLYMKYFQIFVTLPTQIRERVMAQQGVRLAYAIGWSAYEYS